jgi:hypothetical protein
LGRGLGDAFALITNLSIGNVPWSFSIAIVAVGIEADLKKGLYFHVRFFTSAGSLPEGGFLEELSILCAMSLNFRRSYPYQILVFARTISR